MPLLSCVSVAEILATSPPSPPTASKVTRRVPGEDSSVAFLQREFMRIGLKPGNPDGTYIQHVPLP